LKEKVYIVTDEGRQIDDTDAAAPANIYQSSDINNYKIDILEGSVIDTNPQSSIDLVLENFDTDSVVKSISVTSTNFNDQLDNPAELASKIKGSKSKKDRAQRKKQRSQKHIEKYTKRFGELASSNTDDTSVADNSIYYQVDDNSSVQTSGSILTAYKNISTKSSRTRTDTATIEQYDDIESAPKYSDLIDDVSILSASSILNIPVDSVQNSLFDVYSKKYDDNATNIDSNVSLPSIYKSKISSVKSKISGASTESTVDLLHNYKQFTESSKKARSKK
jgi:hypothetical protein